MYIDIWNLIFYVIGIPLVVSVIANLLTRYPEKYLAERSKNKARNYVISRMKYIDELKHYEQVPTDYHTFMLTKLLRLIVGWSAFVLLGTLSVGFCWFVLPILDMGSYFSGLLIWLWIALVVYVMWLLYSLIKDLIASSQVFTGMDKIESHQQNLRWFIDKTMRKHREWLEDINIPEEVWRDSDAIMREAQQHLDTLRDSLSTIKEKFAVDPGKAARIRRRMPTK